MTNNHRQYKQRGEILQLYLIASTTAIISCEQRSIPINKTRLDMDDRESQNSASTTDSNGGHMSSSADKTSRSNSLSIESSVKSVSSAIQDVSLQTTPTPSAASLIMSTTSQAIDVDAPLAEIFCLDHIESLAKLKLNKTVFEYYFRGSDDEMTRKRNRSMLMSQFCLKPRLMRDVSKLDTSLYVFGDRLASPIGLAPTAMHKLAHPDGELATIRACHASNTLMILSLFSNTSLEKVAIEEPTCTKWFNLYILKDRALTSSLANTAIKYNYRALVVSCDAPTLGRRRFDDSKLFDTGELKNFGDNSLSGDVVGSKNSSVKGHSKIVLDPSVTWQDLANLKKKFGGLIKIIAKGIMTPEDAEEALKAGVDAIYISNHGGRQLDGLQSTIEVLPEIARTVGKRCPIFIDGGFRTGTEVLKALALGATMVFIGRPTLWGLAMDGERGAKRVLDLLDDELRRAMMLCGCKSLTEIDKSLVVNTKLQLDNNSN